MMLFDSHCHLDDRSFRDDLDEVIRNALQNGVSRMMTVGINLAGSKKAAEIAETRDFIFASVGVHPHDAADCSDQTIKKLVQLTKKDSVKAWGEIGLDFNRMHSPKMDQEKWFIRQLEVSDTLELPVILHERDSEGRFLSILKKMYPNGKNGVVHCFTGNAKELEGYLELGLSIGVTGIVTIKKRGENLRKLIPRIPDDRLLIETDAPYLIPSPEKNHERRNEPAFVKSVLMRLSEIRKTEPGQLAEITWKNASNLFNIQMD